MVGSRASSEGMMAGEEVEVGSSRAWKTMVLEAVEAVRLCASERRN